jgi:hypothetical protein
LSDPRIGVASLLFHREREIAVVNIRDVLSCVAARASARSLPAGGRDACR